MTRQVAADLLRPGRGIASRRLLDSLSAAGRSAAMPSIPPDRPSIISSAGAAICRRSWLSIHDRSRNCGSKVICQHPAVHRLEAAAYLLVCARIYESNELIYLGCSHAAAVVRASGRRLVLRTAALGLCSSSYLMWWAEFHEHRPTEAKAGAWSLQ